MLDQRRRVPEAELYKLLSGLQINCTQQFFQSLRLDHPVFPDFSNKHRAKAVPQEPFGLMADFNAKLVQQVFYIAKR